MTFNEENSRKKYADIMASLAISDQRAADTLNRLKAKMQGNAGVSQQCKRKGLKYSDVSEASEKFGTESQRSSVIADESFMKMSLLKLDSNKTMKMVAYYMDRICFQCENHFKDLPSDALSQADCLHCCRFHHYTPHGKKKEKRFKH